MRNKFLHIILFNSIYILLVGFSQAQEPVIIKIGAQKWMTTNLDVVTFRNGDTIPEAQTKDEWLEAGEKGQAAWCNQANMPGFGQKYGKLYNWFAVNDPRGLAPKGYHVPIKADWDTLVSYLGGKEIAGKKLKNTEGWLEEGNGTNESGFLGLPGGLRDDGGYFHSVGKYSSWWSATKIDSNEAWNFRLGYDCGYILWNNTHNGFGFSVRCLRD